MPVEQVRILLVDDFEMIRSILKLELRRLGYSDLSEAEDGKAAMDLITTSHDAGMPFNIVICDWNMPEMTGLELLEFVRADDRFKSLPFIMVTAEAELANVTRALKAGATDYIVKPIAADALSRKMDRVLKMVTQSSA